MRWICAMILLMFIMPVAFAHTIEMRLQVSLPGGHGDSTSADVNDAYEYLIGANNFSDGGAKVTYTDAYFTGFGSANAMIALAHAGRLFASSSLDNTISPPAITIVQGGDDSRFIVAFSNSNIREASDELSSGTIHKSRYGNYEYSTESSLVYLYARIADTVLRGDIHTQTLIRNHGDYISLRGS